MPHGFAELLVAGFEGTRATRDLLALARGGLGGVILFARNIEAPAQVAELTRDLRLAAPDVMVAVDQEGGRVARFRAPWTEFPEMGALGDIADCAVADALCARVASVFAAELGAVGVNLDFAPVLDVHTNPANPVIGRRAFATNAKRVAALGAAFIEALQAGGVAACGKHFPGHGDADVDSHMALPVVRHDMARFEECELVPFKAAVKARVASIMTAHIQAPAVDEAPATLSPAWMRVLRDDVGFGGVVFSDDLEMKAVADRFRSREAVRRALVAGVDMVLECNSRDRVEEALSALSVLWSDHSMRSRMESARGRVAAMRAVFPPRPRSRDELRDVIGAPTHVAVRDELLRLMETARAPA